MVKSLEERLVTGGFLIIQTADQAIMKTIFEHYPTATMAKNWCVIPINGHTDEGQIREDLMKEDGDWFSIHMTREQQVKELLEKQGHKALNNFDFEFLRGIQPASIDRSYSDFLSSTGF